MDNQRVVDRCLEVHALYVQRKGAPEIARIMNISQTQVYKDLRRAKEYVRMIYEDQKEDQLNEQVEARKQISREIWESIYKLRGGSMPEDPDMEGLQSLLYTPSHSRAEADLFRTLMDNEKQIEEITGLRTRLKIDMERNGENLEAEGQPVVFDMRTQIIQAAQ